MTSLDHPDHRAIDRSSHKPVILILGPTAGGKSRLAIDLALRIPGGGECISADSMQVYRGMDIGTAKPTAADRARVPHHLLDIAEPSDDDFSVDLWLELAEGAIQGIHARERTAIIVGGTNLYVQAFLHGLLEGPPPDLNLRSQLNALDLIELRRRLEAVDPGAATRIHRNDRKRTIRAIEVFQQTGQPLSTLQTQWSSEHAAMPEATLAAAAQPRRDVMIIGLEYPTELINMRINARVKAMMESGFVDEVMKMRSADQLGRNAREALGYKQLLAYLAGLCTLDDAIEQIKIRTRRFAKQQRTWLRRFKHGPYRGATWIQAGDETAQMLADKALAAIANRKEMPHSTW
jgi:tRNA dimethylallyltransferase